MLNERNMMYGGYYQGTPMNTSYGNFGYQGMPGSLMPMNNYMMDNNPLIDFNTRLNNLENRVKTLEQKINNNVNNSSYQDDNSMYML